MQSVTKKSPQQEPSKSQCGGILGFVRNSIILIVYRGEIVHDAADNLGKRRIQNYITFTANNTDNTLVQK